MKSGDESLGSGTRGADGDAERMHAGDIPTIGIGATQFQSRADAPEVSELEHHLRRLASAQPSLRVRIAVRDAQAVETTLSTYGTGEDTSVPVQIGCVAKLLTAELFWRTQAQTPFGFESLVDELGALPDELRRFLPTGLKVRHLLDHTHGLPDVFEEGLCSSGPIAPVTLARKLASHPLISPPGALFSYGNTGFIIAACLLERTFGQEFRLLLQTLLLDDLGYRAGIVSPCPATGRGVQLPVSILMRFCSQRLQATSLCGGSDTRWTPSHFWRETATPPGWAVESGFGLGWKSYGRQWYGHNGACEDGSLLIRVHSETGCVVVVSGTRASVNVVQTQLFGDRYWPLPRIANFVPDQQEHQSGSGVYRNGATQLELMPEGSGQISVRMCESAAGPAELRFTRYRGNLFIPRTAPHVRLPILQVIGPGGVDQYAWNGSQLFRRVTAAAEPTGASS